MSILFMRIMFLAVSCLCIALSGVGAVDAAESHSGHVLPARNADAVIVSGRNMTALRDKDIDGIRVFAFGSGGAVAIPFQVDQQDSAGNWVWHSTLESGPELIPDDDFQSAEFIRAEAGKLRTHDDEDPPATARMDDNDMLVFLARDAGVQGDIATALPDADTVIEIEVLDPVNGTNGWIYVAWFRHAPPAYSRVRYVSHAPAGRRINTPVYQFQYSENCIVCIEDLRIRGALLVDRINIRGKVRADVGIIHRNVSFAEKDIHGYTEGIIEGPVRIIKRHVVHLELWNLIRTADVICDHYYYPDYAEIPICLPVRFPITEASVFLLTELHDSPLRRTLIGKPGGEITEYGTGVRDLDVTHDLGFDWIAFDSPRGSVVSFVELPRTIAAHAQARPCLCDQAAGTMDAEISAVAGPVAGFVVKSGKDCPKGPHVLRGTYLVSPYPYRPGDEVQAYHLAHSRLVTYVTNIVAGY